jgi:hypothetical protein
MFLPLVKSRINARIRHNGNGIFILKNDHVLTAVGFGRRIFARKQTIFDSGFWIAERGLTKAAS